MEFGRTFVLITRCLMILGTSRCMWNYTQEYDAHKITWKGSDLIWPVILSLEYRQTTFLFLPAFSPFQELKKLYYFWLILISGNLSFEKGALLQELHFQFFPVIGRYSFKSVVLFPSWSSVEHNSRIVSK